MANHVLNYLIWWAVQSCLYYWWILTKLFFLSQLSLLLKGTVVAPPDKFGKLLWCFFTVGFFTVDRLSRVHCIFWFFLVWEVTFFCFLMHFSPNIVVVTKVEASPVVRALSAPLFTRVRSRHPPPQYIISKNSDKPKIIIVVVTLSICFFMIWFWSGLLC